MADLNTQYRADAQVHDALGQDIESLVRESDRNGLLVLAENAACHQDPAVASFIFVTTATDVLGVFIFLGMSEPFLPLLR